MTEKQLRQLKRTDLLELLLTQSKEIDRLNAELEEARRQLEDRRILISNTGSIAEASLAIFHVLEDAQKAADLYLENIYQLSPSREELQTAGFAGNEEEEG